MAKEDGSHRSPRRLGSRPRVKNGVQQAGLLFNAGAARVANGRSIARGHIEEWTHILLETEVLVWTQAAIRF
jgi:hypothetical protein